LCTSEKELVVDAETSLMARGCCCAEDDDGWRVCADSSGVRKRSQEEGDADARGTHSLSEMRVATGLYAQE
jgi:hypothetical protein